MTVITEKRIRKSADELARTINLAKRKLFEFETLNNIRAIQSGFVEEAKDAKDFFKKLKKSK